MNAPGVGGIVFICCFGAAALGMFLHGRLPGHHLDRESKDTVSVVLGLIATMAALVLGLLIASAQNSFDAQNGEMQQVVAEVIQLDRALVRYGPETIAARNLFREIVSDAHARIWSPGNSQAGKPGADAERRVEAFYNALQDLAPKTDAQRSARNAALQLAVGTSRTRMLMVQQVGNQIAWPFLVVLVFWVAMLFLGFGLFARCNVTVTVALAIGALCVASGIFLMLELNQPYDGLLRISDAPIRAVIARMGQP